MNLISLFAWSVYAAETIVSPLPDVPPTPNRPLVTFAQLISPLPSEGQVLGDTTMALTATITPTPTPAPPPMAIKKKNITIAVLGDSMVDTLGPGVPDLKNNLAEMIPTTKFTVLNYGVGATNIEYGLERITNAYEYLGKQIPSLVSQRPDVVVIESFGYNPLFPSEGALQRHWMTLAKMIDIIKSELPRANIVIAATIAPNAKVFGDGAPGITFSTEDKWQRVDVIKKYLESTVKFAQSQKLPLADAYHPSLQSDGNGNLLYINAGDHIHPSEAGRALFARMVTDTILSHKLLE